MRAKTLDKILDAVYGDPTTGIIHINVVEIIERHCVGELDTPQLRRGIGRRALTELRGTGVDALMIAHVADIRYATA